MGHPLSVEQHTAEDLVRRIFSLQRSLHWISQHSMARVPGPGVALQGVMRMIGTDGEIRATDLAEKLGIGPAGLSRHVAELVDLGYVLRRSDPQDRRAYLLSLSDQGREALTQVTQIRSALLQQALEGWSEERARAAAELIDELSQTLNTSFRAMTPGNHPTPIPAGESTK